MSSESTDSDEKKDIVPEIKSVEEIRREKAKSKKQMPVQTQKKSKMHRRLQAEVRYITEQAKKITIGGDWLKPQPSHNNKRTRSASTAVDQRAQAFSAAAVANKKRRVKNVDVSSTSTNLKRKGKAKESSDIVEAPTAVSRRAQAIHAAKRLREMNGRSYSLRSGGTKGLLDVDVGSIITNLKRKGKAAKTGVDLEDMEMDIEEGCKTTKKTRHNDDDMDKDGSGSGAAPEPRVTRSSSRTVDPV